MSNDAKFETSAKKVSFRNAEMSDLFMNWRSSQSKSDGKKIGVEEKPSEFKLNTLFQEITNR